MRPPVADVITVTVLGRLECTATSVYPRIQFTTVEEKSQEHLFIIVLNHSQDDGEISTNIYRKIVAHKTRCTTVSTPTTAFQSLRRMKAAKRIRHPLFITQEDAACHAQSLYQKKSKYSMSTERATHQTQCKHPQL